MKYACGRGTGWRADCLGDLGGFSTTWCHMRQGYPAGSPKPNLQDAWKTAPVAWETCWDMRKWAAEGWPLRYIFNYALACHALVHQQQVGAAAAGRERSGGNPTVLAAVGLPARVEGIPTSRRRQGRRQAPDRHEMAEHRLGPLLPALPPGLPPEQLRKNGTGSEPATKTSGKRHPARCLSPFSRKVIVGDVTVNRWLPGAVPSSPPSSSKAHQTCRRAK